MVFSGEVISYELEILTDFYLTTKNTERVAKSHRENPADLRKIDGFILNILERTLELGID